MSFINSFLRSLSPDAGTDLYNFTGMVAMATMAVAVIVYLVRMRVKLLDAGKGIVIAAIAYWFCVYAQHFVTWYRVGFAPDHYFRTANIAVAFTLLPLVAWLCAKTFNTSVGFAGDVTALALLGMHVPGRSGCTFTGCCYGFPCEWGVYSRHTDANQFPVWWVESLFTLAILVFVLVRIFRKGYVPDGKNLLYFLLFYGVCRFFSEMARESTREDWLFWRISDVHFHMLAMAAVGGFLLWRIVQKERSAAVGEEPSLPVIKGRRR